MPILRRHFMSWPRTLFVPLLLLLLLLLVHTYTAAGRNNCLSTPLKNPFPQPGNLVPYRRLLAGIVASWSGRSRHAPGPSRSVISRAAGQVLLRNRLGAGHYLALPGQSLAEMISGLRACRLGAGPFELDPQPTATARGSLPAGLSMGIEAA